MNQETFEQRLREEIELARALTAVILAARLEVAEVKAEQALERVTGRPAQARNN